MSELDKVLAKTTRVGDCLVWVGYANHKGYGRLCRKGIGVRYVHRYVFELTHGEIPAGHDIDHICWNRACCNPDHLRALPASVNRALQRTVISPTCRNGHEWTRITTYVNPTSGARQCKICISQQKREYYVRRKAS